MADITLYEGTNELNVALTPLGVPVANLYGVATDADTGLPLEGVKVALDSLTTYTDSTGRYSFEGVPPGSYAITFEKGGYEKLTR